MKDLKIIQTDAQKVFFTSDTHYGHNNICRGVSKWADLEENTRDFDTVSDMNDGIVNGINKNVREDDILFHLGDFALYNKKKNFEFRKQIKCKNVHLIKGNHDDEIKNNPKEFSELFSSIQNYKEITVDTIKICLFHYKQMIWNKNHKGSIHLYGHSHANAEHTINGKSMDVGIDNAFKIFGEYRPFGFSEILHLLKDRTQLIIDHHGNKDFYDRKKIIIEHDNLINIAKH